ncbi:IclR family transcriptional regulator [Paracoccus sediminicola]|uniref:IclR family transcriptional regulator n=1 Tax=Paracoccus sediminicola TaxID=3017783 RepID=UPI0022F12272|nr:helix-turn-helix domain-containing protein [Paracoccus sediminicola]WBU56279.1 helix-turn-helix domain-containing protein [Paracoccus sediminicola]
MGDPNHKLVPAVQNAVRIMRLLAAAGRPMGATQIAREADLNVSSAFNILRSLSYEGLLSFNPDDKTYQIGMGLMEFAAPLLGAGSSDLLRPALTEIAQKHGVMIALWQITVAHRIVLTDSFAAPNIVQAMIHPHSRLPVFAGAVGRCYAARLRLDEKAARKGYESVRWQNAPGFAGYWQDILDARDTGFATDRGNLFRGLDIVAAIASDPTGTPRLGISSITIAGQNEDSALDQVAASLVSTAEQVERCVLGGTVKADPALTPPTT